MEQQKEYTPEEILALEKKQEEYYDSKLPFLRKWEEHARLSANLSECRLRKLKADIEYAKIMTDQNAMSGQPSPPDTSGKKS